MKLRVARSAVLDEIWAYITQKKSIEVAERLVSQLTGRFSFLAKNPGVGRSRSELREGSAKLSCRKPSDLFPAREEGHRPNSSCPSCCTRRGQALQLVLLLTT